MSTDFHSLKISNVEKLTRDSVALTFQLPENLKEKFKYIQGQHITLKADINGEDVRRSYSICNSVNSQKLSVGIKAIENGLFSNFAQGLKQGQSLEVMAPQGHFYTQLSEKNQNHYLLVAVGSGITPCLAHIQSIMECEPHSKVTLIYGNKSSALMMFRDKLSFIKNAYLERFNWINLFTQEENEADLFNGRVNGEKLIALHNASVINLADFSDVFLCGPELMINHIKSFFEINKFDSSKIHYELFFAGATDDVSEHNKKQRAEKYGEKISQVSVKVAGRKTKMTLSMVGDNILDAAMNNGADLPFSCKGGVCATCKAKVVKGKVEMDMNHSLTEQEVAEGMILTCQAHPVSDEVEIDFDFA